MTRPRIRATIAWAISVVCALGLGWWAGRATFLPPQPSSTATAQPTYTVASGSVGSLQPMTATVTWPTVPLASATGAGTITTLNVHDGDVISSGDVLYTAGLRPVVIASGSVPAFRDLTVDVTGADVLQLESLLASKGFTTETPDNRFTATTAAAVRRWQKSLGVTPTGVVGVGDIIFAEGLPSRVVFDAAIHPGTVLSGGELIASAAASAPTFTLTADATARTAIPTVGTPVVINGPGVSWDAVVGSTSAGDGTLTLTLTAPDGGAVCAAPCTALAFTPDSLLLDATVELEPEVTGLVVPLSALATAADGSAFVATPDGRRRPVRVIASDGSRSVVEGLNAGDVIALYASPDSAPDSATDPDDPSPDGTSTAPSGAPTP